MKEEHYLGFTKLIFKNQELKQQAIKKLNELGIRIRTKGVGIGELELIYIL